MKHLTAEQIQKREKTIKWLEKEQNMKHETILKYFSDPVTCRMLNALIATMK